MVRVPGYYKGMSEPAAGERASESERNTYGRRERKKVGGIVLYFITFHLLCYFVLKGRGKSRNMTKAAELYITTLFHNVNSIRTADTLPTWALFELPDVTQGGAGHQCVLSYRSVYET